MTETNNTETENTPSIVDALAKVMTEVRAVGKDQYHDAPGVKFKFRGIDAVVNAVGPALRKHRVIVAPVQTAVSYRDVRTSQGKPARECTVMVTYRFHGPAGDYLDVMTPGESMDNGDKGTAKAMSVAFRIALLQALCLPTDEQDPDADGYERAYPTDSATAATNGHANGKTNGHASGQVKGGDIPATMNELLSLGKQIDMNIGALKTEFTRQTGTVWNKATLEQLLAFRDELQARIEQVGQDSGETAPVATQPAQALEEQQAALADIEAQAQQGEPE